jgi:hypothetical protein
MHKQITPATFSDYGDDLDDDSIGASITIDYERDLAMTEPDQPGGRIVWSSGDYATHEEAEAALEEFFERIIEGRYEQKT